MIVRSDLYADFLSVTVASVAIAGLGAAVQTSPVLFLLMKTGGVGYLLSLAVRQFRSPSNLFSEAIRPDTAPGASRGLYLEGFTVATTNPKAIVFCAALFPQFLAADRPLLPQFLVLLATFLTLSITSLSSWSFAGTHARDWFSRGDRARWFNRLMGVAFLLLACGVFALQRSAA